MSSLTRGPLPARVYWRRRIMVLGTALLLVFAFARLLGAGSDASSASEEAAQVAADQTTPTSAATSALSSPASTGPSQGKPGGSRTSQAPVLAEPDGPCADEDVTVSPEVKDAVAGRDVHISLKLSTVESEACTWQVSRDTLTLKITSGKDDIWSTRQCPRAIIGREMVLRRDSTTSVGVTWNARRSDDECSRLTEWALPGFYHVEVAALAGEPTDEQFELKAPTAPVITRSPSPHQSPQQAQPSGRPVASPSGSAD